MSKEFRRNISPGRAKGLAEAAPPEALNPDRSEIEKLAYALWEARGGDGGSPEEDWYRAEQELLARQNNGRE